MTAHSTNNKFYRIMQIKYATVTREHINEDTCDGIS